MDMIHTGFAQSLIAMRKGEDVSVLFRPGSLIYDARNLISLTAIEQKFDRVLWLDADMMFTPDTLSMLHADMDDPNCDRDMVTALYFTRNKKATPVIYSELREPTSEGGVPVKHVRNYEDYPRDSLFQVQGCGFGCVLTSTRLLKDVWDNFGPAFSPMPWCGEDLAFSWRARKLGYEIWCDSRISCGHIGTYVYTEDYHNAVRKEGKVI